MPPPVRERELKLAAPGSFVVPDLTDDGLGVLAMPAGNARMSS